MIIWIGATLVTDWNSVFYRKAVIYKKRVEDELEMRKDRSTTMSKSISSNSSNFDADEGMLYKRSSLYNRRSTSNKQYEPTFGPPADTGPIDT